MTPPPPLCLQGMSRGSVESPASNVVGDGLGACMLRVQAPHSLLFVQGLSTNSLSHHFRGQISNGRLMDVSPTTRIEHSCFI